MASRGRLYAPHGAWIGHRATAATSSTRSPGCPTLCSTDATVIRARHRLPPDTTPTVWRRLLQTRRFCMVVRFPARCDKQSGRRRKLGARSAFLSRFLGLLLPVAAIWRTPAGEPPCRRQASVRATTALTTGSDDDHSSALRHARRSLSPGGSSSLSSGDLRCRASSGASARPRLTNTPACPQRSRKRAPAVGPPLTSSAVARRVALGNPLTPRTRFGSRRRGTKWNAHVVSCRLPWW